MNCKVCDNTSAKNASVSFFRFPKENSRCMDWAKRCNLMAFYKARGTLQFYKSFRICSDHFDPNDIKFDGRKSRLMQSAVPQFFLNAKVRDGNQPDDGEETATTMTTTVTKDQRTSTDLVRNLCRLCAEENRNLTDIFDGLGKTMNLENKLKYFPVEVNRYDALPLRVCRECISKVDQFSDFIANCMKAEVKLRIMLDMQDRPGNREQDPKRQGRTEEGSFQVQVSGTSPTASLEPTLVYGPYVYDEFDREIQLHFSDSYAIDNDNSMMDDIFGGKSHTNLATTTGFDDDDVGDVTEGRDGCGVTEDAAARPLEDVKNAEDAGLGLVANEVLITCGLCSKAFSPDTDEQFVPENRRDDDETCNSNTVYALSGNESSDPNGPHFKCQICFKTVHQVALFTTLHQGADRHTTTRFTEAGGESSDGNAIRFVVDTSNIPTTTHYRRRRFRSGTGGRGRRDSVVATGTGPGTGFRCSQCGKNFRSKPSLRQHRTVHSDERLFACVECGMRFKRKDTLGNHRRIHTGERPFVCKVCGFAFKQRGDCSKHEKNHERTSKPGQ